ncbi:hypothetical protein AVEN_35811-1 [Araneus ventricosus]|uniref:Uncharacterized protein n=1 Tax=Araneus ventricosus TaxID=182803 RepID=A0A4Y2BLI4_ARAVE|nr:hypothetical protein AVEN_35811-1 [Araneus ventricosus]
MTMDPPLIKEESLDSFNSSPELPKSPRRESALHLAAEGTTLNFSQQPREEDSSSLWFMRLVPHSISSSTRQLDFLTSLAMAAPSTGTRLVAHIIDCVNNELQCNMGLHVRGETCAVS